MRRICPRWISKYFEEGAAGRFYYLVKTAHGSRFEKPTFGVSTTSAPRINLLRIEEDLSAAHLRLSRVVIENQPYAAFIERYERADFQRLADQLANIDGKFMLSINDVPETREIFGRFLIRGIETRYTVISQMNVDYVNTEKFSFFAFLTAIFRICLVSRVAAISDLLSVLRSPTVSSYSVKFEPARGTPP